MVSEPLASLERALDNQNAVAKATRTYEDGPKLEAAQAAVQDAFMAIRSAGGRDLIPDLLAILKRRFARKASEEALDDLAGLILELGGIGVAGNLLEYYPDLMNEGLEPLPELLHNAGEEGLGILKRALSPESPLARQYGALLVIRYENLLQNSINLVIMASQSPQLKLREAAALSLKALMSEHPAARDAMVRLLQDDDSSVVIAAARTFPPSAGDEILRPAISRLVASTKASDRDFALGYLAGLRITSPEAEALIASAADGKDPYQQRLAAEAIGVLKIQSLRNRLAKLGDSEFPDVAEAARKSVQKFLEPTGVIVRRRT